MMLRNKLPEKAVLIADDHAHIRKIIKAVVNSCGFKQVVEAQDGREAHQRLIDRNKKKTQSGAGIIQLIICDWTMPYLTGLELLAIVREDKSLSKLPFIMLTAEGDRESIMKAVDLKVSDYVVKPFTAAGLQQKIEAVMARESGRTS